MQSQITKTVTIIFITASLLFFQSCTKGQAVEELPIIDKKIQKIILGRSIEADTLMINAKNWTIEYIKNPVSGEIYKESKKNKQILSEFGDIYIEKLALSLVKNSDNTLTINLAENLSKTPKNFLIGIKAGENTQNIHILQSRAANYELVNMEVKEIQGTTKIYDSAEECLTVTPPYNTAKETIVNEQAILKNVTSTSEFQSSDILAFDWLDEEDKSINMPEVLNENVIVWNGNIPYKEGVSKTFPYNNPYNLTNHILNNSRKQQVTGSVKYLERSADYTFTIKNATYGNTFNIKGVWKLKIPLSYSIKVSNVN